MVWGLGPARGPEELGGRQRVIEDGVRLVFVGMFTVFAFLTLLVGLMRASAAFFEAHAHRFPEQQRGDARAARAGDDAELAVVLALAEALRRGQRI